MKTCPTCQGEGKVVDHVADALNAPKVPAHGASCHCDGPPHAYSPGWCPPGGPK